MKTKPLANILEQVETWPPHLQNELDAGNNDRDYQPTPDELAGIDRGLRAAAEGRFASDAKVKAAFAKYRGGYQQSR